VLERAARERVHVRCRPAVCDAARHQDADDDERQQNAHGQTEEAGRRLQLVLVVVGRTTDRLLLRRVRRAVCHAPAIHSVTGSRNFVPYLCHLIFAAIL